MHRWFGYPLDSDLTMQRIVFNPAFEQPEPGGATTKKPFSLLQSRNMFSSPGWLTLIHCLPHPSEIFLKVNRLNSRLEYDSVMAACVWFVVEVVVVWFFKVRESVGESLFTIFVSLAWAIRSVSAKLHNKIRIATIVIHAAVSRKVV